MSSNNELNHSLKGAMRAGHKYISRTMKNGKWRYTYAKAANAGRAKVDKIKHKIDRAIDTPSENRAEEAWDVIGRGAYRHNEAGDLGYRFSSDNPISRTKDVARQAQEDYANKKLEEYKRGKISKSEMSKILEDTHLDSYQNKDTVDRIDRVQRKGREIVDQWKNRKKK